MADPLLEFDPTSEDAANSPLSIWNTSSYMVTAVSWPAPPLSMQWAGSVDTEGSLPASRKHENRVISITVDALSAAALRSLQAKFAKIAREGGTAKVTFPASSEVVIFDLLAGDSYEPQFDITYYTNSGSFASVSMTFIGKPYGRGAEVDLGDNTETTLPCLVFIDTGVKGDMPGLGRLVIDNDDASNAQRFLVWGIQSRYYSSASTAALFYQAESCGLPGIGSVATGPAGSSGGGANNTVFTTSLPAGSYQDLLTIGASTTAQTHIGSFRVFARAQAPNTNTGTVSLRVSWSPGLGQTPATNTPVEIEDAAAAPIEAAWVLLDLGLVSLPAARSGTQGWIGTIQGASTVAGDDIYIDWLVLVPVLEGSGQSFNQQTTAPITASGSVQVRHDGAFAAVSGGYLPALQPYEGDYLLIPPAGLEARTVRLIVKMSRGSVLSATPDAVIYDPGTDDLSARLFYTPRYLVVPEP